MHRPQSAAGGRGREEKGGKGGNENNLAHGMQEAPVVVQSKLESP